LNGQWRFLKTGIWLPGMKVANQVWKSCFALHSMLLEADGLDGEWGTS
jgi:hypothetical protein